MKKKKNDSKGYIILAFFILFIGIGTITYVGIRLYRYYSDIWKSQKAFEDLGDNLPNANEQIAQITPKQHTSTNQEKPTPLPEWDEISPTPRPTPTPIDYSTVLEKNKDIIGWITIPNTKIDYPVMYTPGNEKYYLDKNVYGQKSASGCLFCSDGVDFVNLSNNITIHGHHMQAGTMFNNLDYYKKESFYQSNKYFVFNTIYRTGVYEVIGVFLTDGNYGSYAYWNSMDTESEFNAYIDFIKKNALYQTDELPYVQYGDKLVSLSTCAYHKTNGRLVVVGKLISTDDENLLR